MKRKKVNLSDAFEVELSFLRYECAVVGYYAWEICNEGRRRACREGVEEFSCGRDFTKFALGGSSDWISYSMECKSYWLHDDLKIHLGYDIYDNIDSDRLLLEQGKALKKAAQLVAKALDEKRHY